MTPFATVGGEEEETALIAVGHRAGTTGLEPGQVRPSDAHSSDLLLPARPHLLEILQPSQRGWKWEAVCSYHGLQSGEDTGNSKNTENPNMGQPVLPEPNGCDMAKALLLLGQSPYRPENNHLAQGQER